LYTAFLDKWELTNGARYINSLIPDYGTLIPLLDFRELSTVLFLKTSATGLDTRTIYIEWAQLNMLFAPGRIEFSLRKVLNIKKRTTDNAQTAITILILCLNLILLLTA
jgi:hypothetical protein